MSRVDQLVLPGLPIVVPPELPAVLANAVELRDDVVAARARVRRALSVLGQGLQTVDNPIVTGGQLAHGRIDGIGRAPVGEFTVLRCPVGQLRRAAAEGKGEREDGGDDGGCGPPDHGHVVPPRHGGHQCRR